MKTKTSTVYQRSCYVIALLVSGFAIGVTPSIGFSQTFQEKSDSIFDTIEGSYSAYFPGWDIIWQDWYSDYYVRLYGNESTLATIPTTVGEGDLFYRVYGDWYYYGTLDEANKYLCEGRCFSNNCASYEMDKCNSCFNTINSISIYYDNGSSCARCGFSDSWIQMCIESGRKQLDMIDELSSW